MMILEIDFECVKEFVCLGTTLTTEIRSAEKLRQG